MKKNIVKTKKETTNTIREESFANFAFFAQIHKRFFRKKSIIINRKSFAAKFTKKNNFSLLLP